MLGKFIHPGKKLLVVLLIVILLTIGLLIAIKTSSKKTLDKEVVGCGSFFADHDVGTIYKVGDVDGEVFFNEVNNYGGTSKLSIVSGTNLYDSLKNYPGKLLAYEEDDGTLTGGAFEISFPDSNVKVVDFDYDKGKRDYIIYRNNKWGKEDLVHLVKRGGTQTVDLGLVGGIKIDTNDEGAWAVCFY